MLNTIRLKERAIELLSTLSDFTESALGVRFERTSADCVPYIETQGDTYVWLCHERGKCIERREAVNEYDALFWILNHYISRYSCEYELRNRVKYVDSRRLAFQTQSRLFSYIGEPYRSMNEKRISEILEKSPYNDDQVMALDLLDDFERTAIILRELSVDGLEYSADCNHSIDYFIEKPYRGQSGGISNFKETFAVMLPKYKIVIGELGKRDLQAKFQGVLSEMDRIGEKITEINLSFLKG